MPARPLPAGACCGSGAGVAWSRRPRAVRDGAPGLRRTQLGRGPRSPPWFLLPSRCRCGDAGDTRPGAGGHHGLLRLRCVAMRRGAAGWLAERGAAVGPVSPRWACVPVPFASFPGKKARTFDLEAMFEQTRRTAVERSRKVLGKNCERSWGSHFKTSFNLLPQGGV